MRAALERGSDKASLLSHFARAERNGTPFAPLKCVDSIRLIPAAEIPSVLTSAGSAALQPSPDADEALTLRFRVLADGLEELEALRHARRMMIREETTLGLAGGQVSLDEAIFSAAEIVWVAHPSQREECLEKIQELARRANRAFEEMQEIKTLSIRR